jgi:hypothetical protein
MLRRMSKDPVAVPPSAAKVLRWKAGHLMEEAIREHIDGLFDSEVLTNQRLFSEELDLTGEYDNYVPEKKTLVEIKTVHDYAFIEREGQPYLKQDTGEKTASGRVRWEPKLSPYLHHEIQNHAYALLIGDVEHVVYVYISLSGRILVYNTDIQPELTQNVLNRLSVLNEAWGTETLPGCICTPEHPLWDSVMQYCPYRVEEGLCCLQ